MVGAGAALVLRGFRGLISGLGEALERRTGAVGGSKLTSRGALSILDATDRAPQRTIRLELILVGWRELCMVVMSVDVSQQHS